MPDGGESDIPIVFSCQRRGENFLIFHMMMYTRAAAFVGTNDARLQYVGHLKEESDASDYIAK